MVKKLICIILTVFLFSNIAYGLEKNELIQISKVKDVLTKYGIVNEKSFAGEKVTRKECIVAVVRIIGVTPEIAKKLNKALYSGASFADIWTTDDSENYGGYVIIAYSRKIAIGEIEDHLCYFRPDNGVTLKEAVAFIMRCLEDSSPDIDATFSRAKEIGLIKPDDSFYAKENDSISPNDLCLLLDRMLDQKCYKFVGDAISNPQAYTYREIHDMILMNKTKEK